MEIRIKTADEFHDSHVTIEIHAADQDEAETMVARLKDIGIREIHGMLADSQARVLELESLVSVERERANENREWAERAEARFASAGLKLAEAQRAIEALSTQVGKISGAVYNPHIASALVENRESWSEGEAIVLATAIHQVRNALGSASLPSSLYTADEAHKFTQPSVTMPLHRRISELEGRLASVRLKLAEAQRAIEVSTEVGKIREAELARVVEERDGFEAAFETTEAALTSERQRANEDREWAERAEARFASAGLKLGNARHENKVMSIHLDRISSAVHGESIERSLSRIWESTDARAMADAIREVRDIVTADRTKDALTSPGQPTSQA